MNRTHRTARRIATTCILAAALGLLIAACGSTKKSSTTTTTSTQTAPTVAASGHAASSNVAVVNGTPITFATYQHWMTAAETSNATENKEDFIIVPLWPPDFSNCISEVRQNIASFKSKSTATLKKDCQQLFTSLNTDTLNFLIQGVWFEQYAAAHGITVTQAQINARFAQEKKTSFKTAEQYQQFLKEDGETPADLMYRTKINLYYQALIKQIEGGKKATTKANEAAAEKLIAVTETAYKAKTACATGFATSYCAS